MKPYIMNLTQSPSVVGDNKYKKDTEQAEENNGWISMGILDCNSFLDQIDDL